MPMPLSYSTPAIGIDTHVHLVEADNITVAYHKALMAGSISGVPTISEAKIAKSLEKPLDAMFERNLRGICLSPRARTMAGYGFPSHVALVLWSMLCNNNIGAAHKENPSCIFPVGMLPLYPGADTQPAVEEMHRCVEDMKFIGFNMVLDPAGGTWQGHPLWDPYWKPILKTAVELDVTLMIHGVEAANPHQHTTGANYLCADINAFEQILRSPEVIAEFSKIRFLLPHVGGVIGQIDRYRGLAFENNWLDPEALFGKNLWFDTCAYGPRSMWSAIITVLLKGLCFASESNGAVKIVDPKTGYRFDDTKQHLFQLLNLGIITERQLLYVLEIQPFKVFPRLRGLLPVRPDDQSK